MTVLDKVAPERLGSGFRWLLVSGWVSNLGDGIALAAGPLLVASQTDEEFRAEARAWLEEHLSGEFASIRGLGGPGSEHVAWAERRAWDRHLAEHGWTCVGWPEEHGGRGLSLAQQVIWHEEYARAEAPARVLLVEDDEDQSRSILARLALSRFETRHARTAAQALEALEQESCDCMILDLGLPDGDGLGLLDQLAARRELSLPPVIVHTGRSMSDAERRRLGEYTQAVFAKEARSVERVAEQVQSFLGRLAPLQKGTERLGLGLAGPSVALDGARVLIADDDMRTVYALSTLLRERGADVIVAETGREALRVLDEHGNVHAVLMDVMMPDMDGYEAMRKMRQHPRFGRLPVIALTARPMQGEKERCEAAGASEYMAKPVDPRGLLTRLGHWLERAPAKVSVS